MTDQKFWGTGYVPRVSARARAGVELALAPDLLGGIPSRPEWTVVDAPVAENEDNMVAHLRHSGVKVLIDTQAWRFADSRTWDAPKWSSVQYLPESPFRMDRSWVLDYVAADLEAQVRLGATSVLLPNWFNALRHDSVEVLDWVLEGYRAFRKRGALHRAVAWVPMRLGSTDQSIDMARFAADSGDVEAIVAQLDRISPLRASVGLLTGALNAMLNVQSQGLPVLAGRFGGVGLTARAFGVHATECGPAEEQTFDAAAMIRNALPRQSTIGGPSNGPMAAPIWFSELGQSVPSNRTVNLRQSRQANAEILCRRPCHQFRIGKESLATSAWHGLISRLEEAARAQTLPASMRLDAARRHLDRMGEAIDVVNQALEEDGHGWQLVRDHVTTQQAVLSYSAHGVA